MLGLIKHAVVCELQNLAVEVSGGDGHANLGAITTFEAWH
jgi:hypothetical protein